MGIVKISDQLHEMAKLRAVCAKPVYQCSSGALDANWENHRRKSGYDLSRCLAVILAGSRIGQYGKNKWLKHRRNREDAHRWPIGGASVGDDYALRETRRHYR